MTSQVMKEMRFHVSLEYIWRVYMVFILSSQGDKYCEIQRKMSNIQ